MSGSKHAKGVVNMAVSLDGFIAREDGTIDWLDEMNALAPEGEDCGFGQFMSSVDALVMGRKTYEKVRSFGVWPYGDTPVVVQSRNDMSLPESTPPTVSHSSESPPELMERLSIEGAKVVYVDGGVTIRRFLEAKCITEVTLTRVPVVIGSGLPLFGDLEHDLKLEHIRTKVFDFGFVQSTYRVDGRS